MEPLHVPMLEILVIWLKIIVVILRYSNTTSYTINLIITFLDNDFLFFVATHAGN